jgi:hypothetical protein
MIYKRDRERRGMEYDNFQKLLVFFLACIFPSGDKHTRAPGHKPAPAARRLLAVGWPRTRLARGPCRRRMRRIASPARQIVPRARPRTAGDTRVGRRAPARPPSRFRSSFPACDYGCPEQVCSVRGRAVEDRRTRGISNRLKSHGRDLRGRTAWRVNGALRPAP